MTFTSTPPTEPGAYWWKEHEEQPDSYAELVEFDGTEFYIRCRWKELYGFWSSRLVPLDEYVEKGGVEKAFREGVHEEHENWFHRKNVPVNVMWRGSRAKALLDGKERGE